MPLVLIGLLLLVAKMADFGPTASWPWWAVLAPFAAAVAWWGFSDSTGLTQRRAMKKMEDRKAERRERSLEALGLDTQRKRQLDKSNADVARRSAAMDDSSRKKPGA